MKTIAEIRKINLQRAKQLAGGTFELLSEKTNTNAAYLSQINNGAIDPKTGKPRTMGGITARKIENGLGLQKGWMDTDDSKQTRNASKTNYTVGIADDFSDDWEEIPYYYAKGACGNGSDNHTDEIRGTLRKEKSWFIRFGVKPENLFTVYAEGDSNADFILDGDMVIFDRSKITPKDGSMFFIKHPAGDRIKTLRRKANGNWLLCSRNHDKTRFPDEEITAEEAQLIEILGEYVYRQG